MTLEEEERKESPAETAGQEIGRYAGRQIGSKIGAGAGGTAAGGAGTAAGTGAGTAAGTAGGAAAGVGAGAGGGAAAGAAAGSVAPGVGTAVGAAAGAALGSLVSRGAKYILPLIAAVAAAGVAVVGFLLLIVPIIIIAIFFGVFSINEAGARTELAITKTANPNHIEKGEPGDSSSVEYTIEVTNNTNSKITNINITDSFSGTYANQVTGKEDCNFDIGELEAGKSTSQKCTVKINKIDEDWILSNTATVTAEGTTITPGGNLDYTIPFRDTEVKVIDEEAVKNSVANNPNWSNNFVFTNCDPGVICWDYVKQKAIAGEVNPAFVLSIWIAESGASHYSGHLSCPNGGIGLSHTVADLKKSVDCFVDLANDFPADQFAKMLDQFCDPATPEICQEPPEPPKTFLASLKSWYSTLVPAGSYGALTPVTSGGGGEETLTASTTTVVVIGKLNHCYQFDSSWSEKEKNEYLEAIALLSRSASFISKLCVSGTVTLKRVVSSQYSGYTNGANEITVYGPDTGSLNNRLYLLAHESGHVIGNYGGELEDFMNSGVYEAEGLVPTYPREFGLPDDINCSKDQVNIHTRCYDESHAETIADYVVFKVYNYNKQVWSGYPGGPWFNNPDPNWDSFDTDWPKHYDYARTKIFGGFIF